MDVLVAAGFLVPLLAVVTVVAGRRHIARLYRRFARRQEPAGATVYRFECPECGNVDIRMVAGTVPLTRGMVDDIRAHHTAHGMCPGCGLPSGWFAAQ